MTDRTVEQQEYWLIVFDDPEVAPEVFTDEAAARRRHVECSTNWHCTLFMQADSPDIAALRRDAERWRKFALCQHLNEESVEAAKNIIGDCPMEVLEMVSILMDLDISTHDFAGDLAADGFVSRTEEAMRRAGNYRESMNSLVEVWGEPEDDCSDDDAAVDALP